MMSGGGPDSAPLTPSVTAGGLGPEDPPIESGDGVVQIIMQGDGADTGTTTAGQLIQLNTDDGQVQYIQVTNENGEQQLLQLMPDGQAHLVQLSNLEGDDSTIQLSDIASAEEGQIQYIEQPTTDITQTEGQVQYTEQLTAAQAETGEVHYIQQLPEIQQDVTEAEGVQAQFSEEPMSVDDPAVSQAVTTGQIQFVEQKREEEDQMEKPEETEPQSNTEWIKVELDVNGAVPNDLVSDIHNIQKEEPPITPDKNAAKIIKQLQQKPATTIQKTVTTTTSKPIDTAVTEPPIASVDTSTPIELTSETVVVINNRKCILSVDPKTSALVAFPIKQGPIPGKRPRGRPRKIRTDTPPASTTPPGQAPPAGHPLTPGQAPQDEDEDDEEKPSCAPTEQENSAAEGLLGLSEADGRRKSMRVKKKPKMLTDEYEIGAIEGVEDIEDDGALPDTEDKDIVMPTVISATVAPSLVTPTTTVLPSPGEKRGRGRPPKAPHTANQVQNFLANLGLPVKRGRGRPRRYPPPGGALNQMPTFIIPSSGGPAVMMAPLQNIDSNKKQLTLLPASAKTAVAAANTTVTKATTDAPTPAPIIIQNADGTQTHIVAGPPTDSLVHPGVSMVLDGATMVTPGDDKITLQPAVATPMVPTTNTGITVVTPSLDGSASVVNQEEDTIVTDDQGGVLVGQILEGENLEGEELQAAEVVEDIKAVTVECLNFGKSRTVMDTSDIMGQPLQEIPTSDELPTSDDPATTLDTTLNEDESAASAIVVVKPEDCEEMMDTSGDQLELAETSLDIPEEGVDPAALKESIIFNDDTDSLEDGMETDMDDVSKGEDSQNTTTTTTASSPSGTSTTPATIIQVPSNLMPYLFKKKNDDPIKIGLKQTDRDLKLLKCLKCGHQAYYNQQYQDHITEMHPEATKCKCCFFHCFDNQTMIEHFKEIHPKCICPECDFTAEHGYIIKRHMMRHTARGCKCTLCGKIYKDRYILKMHVKMVHMPAEVLFECNTCGKKFTRKAHLKRHLRIHEPEKPFKCPECDYRGCERSDITKHLVIHEEPRYSCDVCGKFFRHLKNKELHLKRHKGQRDYKCGMCDFYGYTFTDIRKHIDRKHADAKIVCDKCGCVFRSEALLAEHAATCMGSLVTLDASGYSIMDVAPGANVVDDDEDEDDIDQSGATIQITGGDGNLDADGHLVVDGKHRFIRVEGLGDDSLTVDLSDAQIAEASINESQMVENQISVTSSGQVIHSMNHEDIVHSTEIVNLQGHAAHMDSGQIITDGTTHLQITSTGELIKVEGQAAGLPEGVELVEETELPEGAVLVQEGAGLVQEGAVLVQEGVGLDQDGDGFVEHEHLELDTQELPEGMVLVEGVELGEDVES